MKTKLVEESLALFEKKGFSETSIQDIVDACGVTKGTFYYYFKSKSELLFDIQLDYINDVLTEFEGILTSALDHKARLRRMIEVLIKKIETDGPNARIFFREMRHLPSGELTMILKKRDAIRFKLHSVIEEGIEDGAFRADLKAEFVTFALLGMCNWSYSWFDPKGPETDDVLIDTYLSVVMEGLQTKTALNQSTHEEIET